MVVPSCGIPFVGDLARDEAAVEHAVGVQRRALDLLGERGATRLGFFGHSGGGFYWLHMVATDSKGNVYTGEVDTGERVQRFVPSR